MQQNPQRCSRTTPIAGRAWKSGLIRTSLEAKVLSVAGLEPFDGISDPIVRSKRGGSGPKTRSIFIGRMTFVSPQRPEASLFRPGRSRVRLPDPEPSLRRLLGRLLGAARR